MAMLFGGQSFSLSDQRLAGVQIQTSVYGTPVPLVYGTTRISGNVIWMGDFVATPHTQSAGGKGAMGGGTSSTTYAYSVSFAFGLCEGPISAVKQGWQSKAKIVSPTSTLTEAGTIMTVTERRTVPAKTPFTITLTNSGNFAADISVVNTTDGSQLASGVDYTPPPTATFTGSITTGGLLTVTAVASGVLAVGQILFATGSHELPGGLSIASLGTGAGGAGTYHLSATLATAIASETMRASTGKYAFAAGLAGAVLDIAYQFQATKTNAAQFTAFLGVSPQTPWSYLTAHHAGQDVGYQGLAYVAAANFPLGNSSALPNLGFEVAALLANPYAGVVDAVMSDVVYDMLTNSSYGAGFPAANIGNLAAYSDYVIASGLFMSPGYDQQKKAADILTGLMQLTNAGIYFSEGLLKIVPYGDAAVSSHGRTYTPDLTPVAAITDDELLGPLIVKRNAIASTINTSADAYNQVQIEYRNRAADYNNAIVIAQDQAEIDVRGLMPMPVVTAHEICDPGVASAVAQLILQRATYVRNQYTFPVGWNFCYLEPTDLITITDAALGISNLPVRVVSVEESADGQLTVTAEDAPPGASSHIADLPAYGAGGGIDYNVAPGSVVTPALFPLPLELSSGVQAYVAVTGNDPNWGGCSVWVSLDGNSYQRKGAVNGGSRYGTLTTGVTAEASSVGVRLAGNGGTISSGTGADAASNSLLCWCEGEFFDYVTATLTSANAYTLSGLLRGMMLSAPAAHPVNSRFARIDDGLFKSELIDPSLIGTTIYFKFTSFNIWGLAEENITDVAAYPYVVDGGQYAMKPATVTGLGASYDSSNGLWLSWAPIRDGRPVLYEVRKGAMFGSAAIVARSTETKFKVWGNDSYWISAIANGYYGDPALEIVTGARLVANVIATRDELVEGWPGTITGNGCIYDGPYQRFRGSLVVGGAGAISTAAAFSAVGDIEFFGGMGGSAIYTIPPADIIDIGVAQSCAVSVNYAFRAEDVVDMISAITDVGFMDSFAGNYGGYGTCRIQMQIAGNDGVFGAWADFAPGNYVARMFNFRVIIGTDHTKVAAALDLMKIIIDVPDVVQKGTAALVSGGTAIVYSQAYHNIIPNLQITIQDAQAGDSLLVTAQGLAGFTAQVKNGGAGAARTICWLAQGY